MAGRADFISGIVGSSYLGFSEASTFHPQIGPVVMVVYA